MKCKHEIQVHVKSKQIICILKHTQMFNARDRDVYIVIGTRLMYTGLLILPYYKLCHITDTD